MTQDEIKQFIAERTVQGENLSKIQDELKAAGCPMTYMELRLIASEIESGFWKAQEKPEPKPEAKPEKAPESAMVEDEKDFNAADPAAVPPAEPAVPPALQKPRGKTSVTVSPIQRPGCVASGSVSFGSGASGDWYLDQTGRLGFERLDGKPDQKDIQEFQMELQKAFA